MSLTRPTITGFSGFWSDIVAAGPGAGYDLLPLANNGNRGPDEPKIAKYFKSERMRELVAALAATIGAAAGGTASTSYKREQAQMGPDTTVPGVTSIDAFGGNINIEAKSVINRVTTAADVTYLKQIFSGRLTSSNITYPAVVGGNQDQGPAKF